MKKFIQSKIDKEPTQSAAAVPMTKRKTIVGMASAQTFGQFPSMSQEMIQQSPYVNSQRDLVGLIDNSPKIVGQRKQLRHLLGVKQDGLGEEISKNSNGKLIQQQNTEDTAEEDIEEKGTLPSMMLSEGEVLKGPDDRKLDGNVTNSTSSARGKKSESKSKGLEISVGTVGFESSSPETEMTSISSHKDEDVTVGGINVNWSNPGGKPTGPFGSEAFRPGYSNLQWAKNAKKGRVKIDFTLDVQCPWGVNAGGHTDVPGPTAGVVTKDNYDQIVQDLTPKKKESCWVAPRTTYWSQAICERHEKYHSTDDRNWARGAGKKGLLKHLKKKTIPGANIAAELAALMTTAMQKMSAANMKFYKGGSTSYYSYAGEKRAFGDGKKPYKNLAKGVKKHGENLEKAAANNN